jgi:hypothetical protein
MRGLADANRNQLASDVHFLTAPLKFIWGMFVWAIVLLPIAVPAHCNARVWHSLHEP